MRWWEESRDSAIGLTEKLNAYLKSRGAKTLDAFEEIFTGSLAVIPSFPEFDPMNITDKYNTHFVGPILQTSSITDANVKKLFNDDSNIKCFCYTGRFFDNVGESGALIFENIVMASDSLDIDLVISTGSEEDKQKAFEILGNMNRSKDIKIVDYASVDIGYGDADIVVHHGGHGS